ncbi:hypothetical protein V5O48_000949 [Marasmius crinis-equi]|uniref:BRCA2 OB1 domain-containing protein n=1 Tax=Marasmius crinis-equi TaxID=585013 RepID=A0ABR3G0F0_9AGAR
MAVRALDCSPFSSPSRKRQRLSSPEYDDQFNLSQQDLEAINQIEHRLSQPQKYAQNDENLQKNRSNQLSDDPFGPETHAAHKPATSGFGFASASSLTIHQADDWNDDRSSPEPNEEKDYSSWFDSAPVNTPVGFQKASTSFTSASTSFASASSLGARSLLAPASGFQTASKKGLIAPSATALAKAQEKMKEIWGEELQEPPDTSGENAFRSAAALNSHPESPQRPPLRSLGNSFDTPVTPCPPAVVRPTFSNATTLPPPIPKSSTSTFQSPLISKAMEKHRPKPFKSPLAILKAPVTPLIKSTIPPSPASFVSARSHHPVATTCNTSFQTPLKSKTVATPASTTWSTPSHSTRSTPARFVTPFKPGMKPGEPGRNALEKQAVASTSTIKMSTPASIRPPLKKRKILFDLKPPADRKTLLSSGLVPQSFTREELEGSDIDYEELSQVNLQTAQYYSFYCSTPTPENSQESLPFSLSTATSPNLGAQHAWERLTAMGCELASRDWVFNHWALILWKLAGMVALDPETEATEERRWCWSEIWNQLLYRYERELNSGIRPPLRRITVQDSPASCPMVLCISGISWPKPQVVDGQRIAPHPELEVTDGWYKLRAAIDAPLARAVQKGSLRVGRKIAVAGARLDSERKDGVEILEAYTSCKLVLNGNSSHLAPWHAKLGFQSGPFIATLRSLTPDGGMIPVMDLVVTKVISIAFWEFWTDETGQKRSEGPRNEADEAKCVEKWKAKRQAAESKLRDEHEKKIRRYLGYADRLEHKCRGVARGDEPPDSIESMYDELEEPEDAGAVIIRATSHEAGWLARLIRAKIEKGQETIRDEIEKELDDTCPPRNIRSFRVIFVQDARGNRHPSNRTAQLTIWDILNVQLMEDKPPGYFEPGYRCIATNLMPTKQKFWMGHKPGDEIYLVSTRATKWQRIKSTS